MSDDFNHLRPPEGDDDDWLDWQSDDEEGDKPASSSGDQLGFTGELSWRQDVEKAFSDQLDEASDNAEFDWQPGSSESVSEPDELDSLFKDWQGDAPADDQPPAESDDVPDWLAAFTGDEPEMSEPSVDLPPWLAQFDASDEEPEAEPSPLPLSDVPAWLRDDSAEQPDQPVSEPLPGGDLPPWLVQSDAGNEEPEAEQSPAPLPDVPAWLREDAEETFEQPAPADDLPTWLSGADVSAAEAPAIPGGDVPPWLSGLDEPTPAVGDEDDLFAGLDEALGIAPGSAAAGEPADWMSAADEALEAEASLTGLDAYLVDEVVDEDFFADVEAAEAEVPDWLRAAAPVEDEEAAEAPVETPVTGDLFSGWTLETPPAAGEESEAVEELPTAEGDFFQDLLPSAPAASDETEAVPEADLLAGWEAARQTFGDDDEPPAEPEEQLPDWLTSAAPLPEMPPAAAQDIFGELGLPSPATGFDFLDNPPEDEEATDWFPEEAAASAEPGWLGELGELDLSSAAEEAPEPATADFLAELRGISEPNAERQPDYDLSAPTFDDIDSLLAAYEDTPAAVPESRALADPRLDDVERLLSDDEIDEIAALRSPRDTADDIVQETPDWLAESGVVVGGTSAGAILRRQTERERPLEELNERLQALHDRGLELPPPVEEAPPSDLKTLLPGVKEFIAPTPIKTGATGITGEMLLTPQQIANIQLLRTLAPVEAPPLPPAAPSALDQTYAAPSFADIVGEEDEAAAAVPEVPPAPPRVRRRVKFDRLLITLLVALGVLLPFVVGALRVGDLPPAQFAAGSRQQAAFERMDTLAPGDLVLIAAEYGPTGAGELDSLTEALLRHALLKGARPVIISTNPLGLLHVQNILNRLTADEAFTAQISRPLAANRDFYVARYVTGSVVGLRALAQNISALLAVDISGRATNLAATSLQDFALIVTIAERAEDARAWAEQVAPLAGQPLVLAVGYAAAPLAEPYVLAGAPENLAGLRGLLIGYGDAYTYRVLLDGVNAVAPDSIPTLPPTTPPPTPLPPTPQPVVPAEGAATLVPEEVTPETAPGTEATTDALTPAASAPADEASTAEAGSTLPEIFGVINASQTVNVREGPARTFRAVAAARPGQRVQIIGRSGDGGWLQIRLDDDVEGWISAALVEIEEPATPTPDAGAGIDPYAVVALVSDGDVIAFQTTNTLTPDPSSSGLGENTTDTEATAEPTAIVTADAADVVTGEPTPYRDERWFSMTFGLLMIIVVITVGTVVNVIGSLFRRRRR